MDEEIWAEEAAHHAVIYDIKWTKNDRYLITTAGDGTCKIWDFFAYSPIINQYTAAYNTYMAQTKTMNMEDDATFGPMATARTLNTHNTANNLLNTDENLISPPALIKMNPPKVVSILPLAAGISGYSAAFQDFITSIPAPGTYQVFTKQALDVNYWSEQVKTLRNYKPPRVIVGCSDGRIRVFDQGRFVGFVVVASKNANGENQDFSPHDGVVNSVVIDERSK